MPFIMVAIILAAILLDEILTISIKSFLYSISLTIMSVIVTCLPILIFCLLFKTAANLSHKASKIIILILFFVCCSNFISTFLSHYVGIIVYDHFNLKMILPNSDTDVVNLQPLWNFKLPQIINNDKAMFTGIVLGILTNRFYPDLSLKISKKVEYIINYAFKSVLYLMPIFIFGFIVKLQYEGSMYIIFHDYLAIIAIIGAAQFSYILLLYLFMNNFVIANFMQNLKNMLPAVISAFSTMSSVASMPLTILGVQNSVKNKEIANSVIPITVNIHLIGDCFAIPILAYAIMKSFGIAEPNLGTYMLFAFYFVLAKFSVAAIPGGGVIVMLPILEKHLGFNTEMMSMITATYILFDPIITSANVLGNGVFAKFIDKLIK